MTAFEQFNTKVLPLGFDDIRAQELDAIDVIKRCGTLDTQLAPASTNTRAWWYVVGEAEIKRDFGLKRTNNRS